MTTVRYVMSQRYLTTWKLFTGKRFSHSFSYFSSSSDFDFPAIQRRTAWEFKQMAIDRGCYIDQSQSLNIHLEEPRYDNLTSLHLYAWTKVWSYILTLKHCPNYWVSKEYNELQQGLKTGMRYLRSRATTMVNVNKQVEDSNEDSPWQTFDDCLMQRIISTYTFRSLTCSSYFPFTIIFYFV